jgi:hypothetical protein
MNRTRAGGIAAGVFAVGLLTGLAGTAVARDNVAGTDHIALMAEHMSGQDTAGIRSMMGGSMMGGSMMGGSMMGDPDASSMPGSLHEQHHPSATPGTPR